MEKNGVEMPAELKLTPAIITDYSIVNSTLAYAHLKLGIATYEITTKKGNFLLKLIAPSVQQIIPRKDSKLCNKFTRLIRSSYLLALKCSQLPSFSKVISHKVVNNVLHVLMPMPDKKVTQYVSQAKIIRLKDIMNLIAQIINAITELDKLGIVHYVISLNSIYLTPTTVKPENPEKKICITEILPDISPFIECKDAISEEDGFQLPPEAWEKFDGLTVASHIYISGHYCLKFINSNPVIVNYIQSITSGQESALQECNKDQLEMIMDLINRMVDVVSCSRPSPHELLFYFQLFALGNANVAVQISKFSKVIVSVSYENR